MSSLINHQIIPGTRRLSECLEFCSIGRLFKYIGHRIKNLLILLDFCSIYDINGADDLCYKFSLLIGTNTVFGITMDAKSTLVFNTLAMRWFKFLLKYRETPLFSSVSFISRIQQKSRRIRKLLFCDQCICTSFQCEDCLNFVNDYFKRLQPT